MSSPTDLTEAIAAVCPIDGICVERNRIDFRPEATVQQRVAAQAVWDGWDFSDAAQQARDIVKARDASLLDRVADAQAVKDRAILIVVMDELNLLRQWVTDFKSAVAAATSLANLQTRVAATSNLPQRTANQIRPAVQAKMTDGSADS